MVQEWPNEKDLADIVENAAVVARQLGLEPRVAFVSFSTFGHPVSEQAEKMYLAPAAKKNGFKRAKLNIFEI